MTYEQAKHFITEHLRAWGLYSAARIELMLLIAAHESLGFKQRRQLIMKDGKLVPEGKARGPWGMEPRTHSHVWDDSDTIAARALKYGMHRGHADQMINDDVYALWVAVHYILMDPKPLPTTPQQMAEYAKSYWNRGGAATPEKYLADWKAWKQK